MFNIRRPRSVLIQHLIKILAYNLFVYERVSAEQQQQQQKYVFLLEIKIFGHVVFRNIDFKIYYSDRRLSKLINDAKDYRWVWYWASFNEVSLGRYFANTFSTIIASLALVFFFFAQAVTMNHSRADSVSFQIFTQRWFGLITSVSGQFQCSKNHQQRPLSAVIVFSPYQRHGSWNCTTTGSNPQHVLPHRVEERAVVNQTQQFVRCRHVVGHRLLPVVEEGVRSPDLTGQQVVQGQNLHGSIELQPFVPPALTEEDVDGVLLRGRGDRDWSVRLTFFNRNHIDNKLPEGGAGIKGSI